MLRLRISLPVRVFSLAVLAFGLLLMGVRAFAAGPNSANLTVTIVDKSQAYVPEASSVLVNLATGLKQESRSNKNGMSSFPFLSPGKYRLLVHKDGFANVAVDDILLNVGDDKTLELTLEIGTTSQIVSVSADQLTINTTDASVSTVIDRKFVENIPLNGRSFQSLILLSPGTVTNTPQRASNLGAEGEFSVNGQRTESNYYTVDGVSANSGASTITAGAGITGSLPASTALGTTQGLVSVDALQEFRVESSTYSAEYGRNPGGQFAMATRSGTNDWHGAAFDYFRNDVLDSNSWFNDHTTPITPKGAERQNDFGGTFGGPILIPHLYNGREKSFFFFSYEGLRLVQPQDVSINYVPDLALRQSTPAPLNQLLNAFPLPTPGAPELGSGLTEYIAGWSSPSSLDAVSVRFDQSLGSKLHIFFRFSNTPSTSATRGSSAGTGESSPSVVNGSIYGSRTYTGGATNVLTTHSSNDLRINFSDNTASNIARLDGIGGAIPISFAQLQGVDPSVPYNLEANLYIGNYDPGINEQNSIGAQKQWNIVDTVSTSIKKHLLKMGVDWRRLTPVSDPDRSSAYYEFDSEESVLANSVGYGYGQSNAPAYPLYQNLSLFIQDDWKLASPLSLAMGLRWDVNPAPGVTSGEMPYTVTGLNDLKTLALAPQGTSLWKTSWFNLAPRLGLAYIVHSTPGHESVLRAGGGVFFDTGQQAGSSAFNGPGFSALRLFGTHEGSSASFPVPPSTVSPPIVSPPSPPYGITYANSLHLQLPYTFQWNASLEQAVGKSQSLTISYVGANGRKLLEEAGILGPQLNPHFSELLLFRNGLTSSYNALQVKFQRQLAQGLQTLASYTWAHALDFGSYNAALPYQHGNSDQDVRSNFTAAVSYDLPNPGNSRLLRVAFKQWGVDGKVTARTGFPITLNGNGIRDPATGEFYFGGLNLIPGVPIYQPGPQYPGNRRVNSAAFRLPTSGQSGNAPRNFARGFGVEQTDIALRRQISIFEHLQGQFRVEAFNVFNHPSFGAINPFFGQALFGQATASLAQSLGVLSPLYQVGGPRSLQLNLKLTF